MSILKGDCNTGMQKSKDGVEQQLDEINEMLEQCRRLEAVCCLIGLSYSVGLSSSVGLS